jgi:hypothetical protein
MRRLWIGLAAAALVGVALTFNTSSPVLDRDVALGPLPIADWSGAAVDLTGRPWIINVWMPACAPCQREVPGLVAAREAWEAEGVGFLAVSISPERPWVDAHVKRWGFDLPQVHTTGNLLEQVGVTEVPFTMLVSREGRLVGLAKGEQDADYFDTAARALLAAGPPAVTASR